MGLCLSVDPPLIIPWLSVEERQENILLLDFDADIDPAPHTLRVDLNVVFNPISVRRGTITHVDYYIGSTGAEIIIEATKGTIHDHTRAAKLDVSYSNSSKIWRKAGLNLAPAVKVKIESKEIESKLGTISRDAADEKLFTATFSSEERFLAPVLIGDTIKWTITLPRGEKVIRDFLIGNLYLFAKCTWKSAIKSGSVSVHPSDVRFFDSNRRPIGSMRSILMQYVLWKRSVKIRNIDGFRITYREVVS